MKFFKDRSGETFVHFKDLGRWKTYPLHSRDFESYISMKFNHAYQQVPSTQALKDVVRVLEGQAEMNRKEYAVNIRLARKDGTMWLDLADDEYRVVEVSASNPEKWRVIDESLMYFRRSQGMDALPVPEQGGSIDELRPFVNVETENDFILYVHWLIAAFNADYRAEHCVLVLHGEEDSGKSKMAEVAKQLIDPSEHTVRSLPSKEDDLIVATRHAWILAFDNLSEISAVWADRLCRLATGGSFGTRKFYTNTDEVLIRVKRPFILGGIEEFVVRPDLARRMVVLNLPPLKKEKKKDSPMFWKEFEAARPRILGALLDAVHSALYYYRHLQSLPCEHMVDFERWSAAAALGLPWTYAQFKAAYDENRLEAKTITTENDEVSLALFELAETSLPWAGTASELLNTLTRLSSNEGKGLPKLPHLLSRHLKRIKANMRKSGIKITTGERTGKERRRLIRIEREEDSNECSH
jgi:hypothetical protein